jgi:hypothetical protein
MKTVIEMAREALEYRDGALYWKDRPLAKRIGERAGSVNSNGYRTLRVGGKTMREHRIIFALHHGYMPIVVDHINNDRTNNRIENLRAATIKENQLNSRTRVTSSSGVKNVHWHKATGQWQVMVRTNGKRKHVGLFDDLEDAKAAAILWRNKYQGEFANHG